MRADAWEAPSALAADSGAGALGPSGVAKGEYHQTYSNTRYSSLAMVSVGEMGLTLLRPPLTGGAW